MAEAEEKKGCPAKTGFITARFIFMLLLIGLAIGVAFLLYLRHVKSETGLVPYTPVVRQVVRGDHSLVDAPELANEAHFAAMVTILNRYGERFERKSGKLWIERKLAEDRDLLSNYTEKAQNTAVDSGSK